MAVIGGVPCDELHSGFSEGAAWGEGASAQKNFLCNWFDRYTLANAVLGVTSYTIVGGKLVINAPGAFPDSPNLIARQAAIRPLGASFQGPRQIAYEKALITVSYGVPQWQPPGSDPGGLQSFDPSAPLVYATQSIKYGGQWLTIPRSKIKIAGTNAPLDHDHAGVMWSPMDDSKAERFYAIVEDCIDHWLAIPDLKGDVEIPPTRPELAKLGEHEPPRPLTIEAHDIVEQFEPPSN